AGEAGHRWERRDRDRSGGVRDKDTRAPVVGALGRVGRPRGEGDREGLRAPRRRLRRRQRDHHDGSAGARQRDVPRRGDRRGRGAQERAAGLTRRARGRRRGHQHDDVVAVGQRAGGGVRARRPVRRAARVQPGPADEARRTRLSRWRDRCDARTRHRAVRRTREAARRRARPGRLRRQPPAVSVSVQRGRLHGADGPAAGLDRHVHAARRGAPDGADRAAGLHRARRVGGDRRRDRRRRPAVAARPLRRRRAGPQDGPRAVPAGVLRAL
ncbi:MAG: 3-hydroxybutyryl-CoA dehydrogenase; 3-hydroxyacyl-CoA dehydrogenase, partial [uncultured Solirubrobacteraceae bacterium]